MKQIENYINEKLHITTKSYAREYKYTCHPTKNNELRSIIIERIKNEGPDCDLNDIDVSNMTDMSNLFNAHSVEIFKDFNGDISRWDVSNVTNMAGMFSGCEKFNCDISLWNVSNVTTMMSMFYKCKSFRQKIDNWDVSNVKSVTLAFYGCLYSPKWYYKILYKIKPE